MAGGVIAAAHPAQACVPAADTLCLLDDRVVNGHFWFFYGALSDVGYTITVEDLVDGHRERQYVNPPGEICGRGDTAAFID